MPPSLSTSEPAAKAAPPPPPPRAERLAELDWVKGALVVFMVVYHTINYSTFRPLSFQYLAFLPPSFILITGFVVAQIYARRYDLKSWAPYLRLATRGLKILLLFTALNLAYFIAAERSFYYGFWALADRSASIFLYDSGRVAIFEVLLPIAYFLLLSPLFLWIGSRFRRLIPAAALVVITICVLLEKSGHTYSHLSMFSAGLIGMALGIVPMHRIDWVARKWILVLLFYGAYRLIERKIGAPYAVQMLAATISVLLLYSVALYVRRISWLWHWIVLVGQYSLLAYLAQIAFLQVLVKVMGSLPTAWPPVILMGAITLALTWLTVVLTRWLRTRSRAADTAYKTIFA